MWLLRKMLRPLRDKSVEGKELVRRRKLMGLTAEALAGAIGVHRVTLYHWEADRPIEQSYATSARVVMWIMVASEETLRHLGQTIEAARERGEDGHSELYSAMLAATKPSKS